MLMWEISSGKPPFINYEHNYNLAMNIINGIRPKIVPGTPFEYECLMKQCWDADPLKRPDAYSLALKINRIIQSKSNESFQSAETRINLEKNYTSSTSSVLFTSKIHRFKNLPEPRNATEGIIRLSCLFIINAIIIYFFNLTDNRRTRR